MPGKKLPPPSPRFAVGDLVVIEPSEWRDEALADLLSRGVGYGDVGRVKQVFGADEWRTTMALSSRAAPAVGYAVEVRRGASSEIVQAADSGTRAPVDRAKAEALLAILRAPAKQTQASLVAAGLYDAEARVVRPPTADEAGGLLRYWYALPQDAWNDGMWQRLRRYERLFLREIEEVVGLPFESLRAEMRPAGSPLAAWEAGMDARGSSRVKAAMASKKRKPKATPLP